MAHAAALGSRVHCREHMGSLLRLSAHILANMLSGDQARL
jgi:hypothetical protein